MAKSIKDILKKGRGTVFVSVGLDVSDGKSCFVGLSEDGRVKDRGKVMTRTAELEAWAMSIAPTVMALEAGPHSPWISRLLTRCGHEAIVGNPAKIPSISRSRSEERLAGRRAAGATGAL